MDIQIYADIVKVDDEKRMAYGYASTERLDSQGEMVSKVAIEDALPDYMKFANIREMHQLSAVGVAEEAILDEKGLFLGAKVVDDAAWKKVKEKVYKGFSIGGKSLRKADNKITKLALTEISLVDRPSNPDCVFTMFKADVEAHESKTKKTEELKKGMWTVSELARLLDSLNSIRQSSKWETQAEGDNSPVPAKLKEAVNTLASVLQEMVAEETKELTADQEANVVAMAAKTDDLVKGGARNSKSDLDRIQKMHDLAMELGASCGTDKAAPSGDILKALTTQKDDIQKAFDDKDAEFKKVAGENESLKKRISDLESQAAPAKAVLKGQAIEKTEDGTDLKKNEEKEPEDALGLIKKIHQEGAIPIEKIFGGR